MLRDRVVYRKRIQLRGIPVSTKDYLDTTRPTVSSLLLHSKGSEPIRKGFDGFVLHDRHYSQSTNVARTY
jgi:hypothetical protein